MKKCKILFLILLILNPIVSFAEKKSVIMEDLTWMEAEL